MTDEATRFSKAPVWLLRTVLAVALTFFVHEAAHGLTTWALGYDTFVRINSAGLVSGDYRSAFDADLTDAVGPLITIVQAMIGLTIARRWAWPPAFIFVATALMMRVLGAVASLTGPNDEARLGLSWGVGYWTVHAVVIAILAALTLLTIKQLNVGRWRVVATIALTIPAMVAVVVGESYLPTLYLSAY